MNIAIVCGPGLVEDELVDLLEAAGLPAGPLRSTPGPALVPAAGVTWFLASAAEVFAACGGGAAGAAIAGKDVVLEMRPHLHELLDLRVCADTLVYATRGARPAAAGRARPRAATRYPRLTRQHFAGRGVQVEALTFATPCLAVALGLADGVVELRGRLGEGGPLEERHEVAACSARLLASRAARALRADELAALVSPLRALLEEA